MDPVGWLLLTAILIALVVMVATRLRSGRVRTRSARPADLRAVLSYVGPRRCTEATRVLRVLAEAEDSDAISQTWILLERSLLEALPDCPPEGKPALAEALTACAAVCVNRETSQGMILIRNSLLSEPVR